MVIYHRLAFDHKLLNLKNIIGTETELCIHLHLFRQQIFSEGLLCSRHWDCSQVIWNVKEGGVHVRKDRSSLWVCAGFHKPSVSASRVGSLFPGPAGGQFYPWLNEGVLWEISSLPHIQVKKLRATCALLAHRMAFCRGRGFEERESSALE